MANWRGYDHLLSVEGKSEQERSVYYLKNAFISNVVENPGYEAHAKRNGLEQPMLFTRGDVRYKVNVVAMPGDELYPGDLIEAYGEHWICVETRAVDTIQKTGLLWLCNHEFKWQNFSSEICTSYGVLDSGVYSTTKNGDEQLQYLDKQYKIYLPFNENTEKIFVDKRIATCYAYDSHGEKILTVYSITGLDYTSRSYGNGAHLLILNARSSAFNASTDNLELGICDYIKSSGTTVYPQLLNCAVIGKPYVVPGKTRTFKAEFYDENGKLVNDVRPQWGTDNLPEGVSVEQTGFEIKITVSENVYIGTTISFTLTDLAEKHRYNVCAFELEVKAYG